MKNQMTMVLSVVLSVSLLFGACSPAPQAARQPTADIQATVDAGIAATAAAQAALQATVDQAVVATITAMPTATLPAPDELSEEELAAMVDDAVNQALAASEQANTSTTSTTSADDMLTEEELAMLYSYYGVSETEIEYALELAEMYLELYYDLGSETVALLDEVVNDLETLYTATEDAMALLDTLEQAAAGGGQVSPEQIAELMQYSDQIMQVKDSLQGNSSAWLAQLQGDLSTRAQEYLNMQPNDVAGNRVGAIRMAGDYVNSVRSALADGLLDKNEMQGIAQLGANVTASFNNLNLSDGAKINSSINDITGQLARGQLPQASANLGNLEGLLGR